MCWPRANRSIFVVRAVAIERTQNIMKFWHDKHSRFVKIISKLKKVILVGFRGIFKALKLRYIEPKSIWVWGQLAQVCHGHTVTGGPRPARPMIDITGGGLTILGHSNLTRRRPDQGRARI